MSAAWITEAAIADWLIKSTALIALACAAASGARVFKASAALRHLLWLLAIASAVAVPAIAAITPMRLEILPAFYEPVAAQGASVSAPAGSWLPTDALFAIYAYVAIGLLLRIALGQWRLNQIWRGAHRLDSIDAQAAALAAAIGLSRSVAVRVADGDCAPMTWGFARPKIVLPAAAIGWPSAQRRLVLMHELAHVARADSFTQLLTSLALAFTWFHPALWFAAARLRREQEHACDERVLLAGAAPDAYARTLLDVAAGRFDGAATAAAMIGAQSQLEARLKTIVAERPRMISFASGAAISFGAAVTLVGAAIATPAPPTPPVAAVPAVAPVAQTPRIDPTPHLLGAPEATPTVMAVPRAAPSAIERTPRTRTTPTTIAALPALPAIPATPAIAAIPATPPAAVVAPTAVTPPTPVVTPTRPRVRPP